MQLSDKKIEDLLHQAPLLRPPSHLLNHLESQIQVAHPSAGSPTTRSSPSWKTRWMPLAALWVMVLGLAAGVVLQHQQIQELEEQVQIQENVAVELEALKKENDTYQKLFQENKMADSLQAQVDELQKLRQEATSLKERAAQMPVLQEKFAQRAQALQQSRQRQQVVVQGQTALSAEQQAIAQRNACIANLKQLESAKEQWGLENRQLPDAVPTFEYLIGDLGYIKRMPVCPNGGAYRLGPLKERPTCSHAGHELPF